MGRIHASLIGTAAMLAACATPGIDYEARIMPNAPEAAELRNVTVERFDGPSGGWFAGQLERVLASAQFDGQYWFNVSDPSYAPTAPDGIYSGFVEVIDVNEHHSEHYDRRCVKREKDEDGEKKCVKWQDYIEYCVSTELDVAAFVELREPETGVPVFSATYPGSANDYYCDEYRKGRGHAHFLENLIGSALGLHDIGYGFGSPGALIREALSDTLGPIRRDVAPRNAIVRAEFVTKPISPYVKNDARFKQAVSLGRKDPVASCNIWALLGETYPDAPSVTHNLATCSEASGNYAIAQDLYAKASEQAGRTPGGAEMFREMTQSLSQISARRSDVIMLERLISEEAPTAPES